MKKHPLTVGIEVGELVIRIGIDTLKMATDLCPYLYDGLADRSIGHVINPGAWAKAIVNALEVEEEDGTTPVQEMLDRAIREAVDNGDEGFEFYDANEEAKK